MAETRDMNVLAAEALVRGKRSLIIEDYTEAAEELSSVCEMLTELHGPTADQLAEAYLLYGRALLGCAREEAKLLDITETAPDTQDSESDLESGDKAQKDKPVETSKTEESSKVAESNGTPLSTIDEKPEDKAKVDGDEKKETQEKVDEGKETEEEKDGEESDKEENMEEDTANDEDEEDEGDVGSLQLAWEVLELSSQILSKKEDHDSKCLLAEVFSELGEVSLESSNFETALKDFTRSLEIYEKLEKPMPRDIAEANFKIGLSHALMNMFEEAVKDFNKAIDILDVIIKETPTDNKTLLEELNQTKEEILLKITDVKESKEQSLDAIREQLNKVWPKSSNLGGVANGAGASSSTANGSKSDCLSPQNDKPAADISHLVKRKRKTDDPVEEASCPKKPTP